MYTIHADGQLLFDSLSEDVQSIALSPKLLLDVNKAGSLSLVLPPGNKMHGNLKKLKSLLTVEQDGEQLARVRAMETETDTFNQQSVFCEGDKAFLKDSVFAPGELGGNVQQFFRQLINNHNGQVETEKQFVVGVIDAVDSTAELTPDSRLETRVYWCTLDMIEESLLNVYGGYIRTRTVDGIHYIDWVKQYGDANAQPIEFSVNLLDLNAKVDAGDVFTVLIPLGACEIGEDGEYTDPVSIAGVNNGLNYIQDDVAVALYGKIWRTKTWSYIEDPAQLLAKGREHLKTGIEFETITLKAIDMHFVDGNIQPIRIGDMVRILSEPHGLDRLMLCSQIEIDLLNPENTQYTFGEKPRTITENVARAEEDVNRLTGRGGGSGGRSVKEELTNIRRWADTLADEERGIIALLAGEEFKDIDSGEVLSLKEANLILNGAEGKAGLIAWVEEQGGRLSAAEIELDGVNAQLTLAASRLEELEGKTTSALIELDGANAQINLHAQAIEDHGKSITRAEIAIDGLNSEISLKADKIDLEGYVTIDEMEAEVASVNKFFTGETYASSMGISGNLYAENVNFPGNVSLLGRVTNLVSLTMGNVASHTIFGAGTDKALDLSHSHAVTVNNDGTITLGEVSSSGGTFRIADTAYYQNGVSAARSAGYTSGKTDWSPVKIERTSYSTADKTVTVRALNSAGVPLIALEKIDASEIYEAGANAAGSYEDGYTDGWDDAADGVVISNGTPVWTVGTSTVTFKIRVYARLNGTTIESTDLEFSKRI